jgi:hypothetical protein
VAAAASTFDVRSATGDAVVLSGTLSPPRHDDQTGQDLQHRDFDVLVDEGRYHASVPGVGRSATFGISHAPYEDAFRAVMPGFYGARFGIAVTFSNGGSNIRRSLGSAALRAAAALASARAVRRWREFSFSGANGLVTAGSPLTVMTTLSERAARANNELPSP